jgi:hypothetical protein
MLRVITRDIEAKAHGFKIELVHVRKADIGGQSVPLPSMEEQSRIAAHAQVHEKSLSTVMNQIDILKNLRATMLDTILHQHEQHDV